MCVVVILRRWLLNLKPNKDTNLMAKPRLHVRPGTRKSGHRAPTADYDAIHARTGIQEVTMDVNRN
jgi:hypothetical protein